MKYIVFVLLFLVLLSSAFGAGRSEPFTGTLMFLHSGPTPISATRSDIDYAIASLKADYPDVTVQASILDLSDGSALTMTAMIAAGQAPNVYRDTLVRASAYITPEYALPLDDYLRDIDKYQIGVLDPYRRDGKLLALPVPGEGQGMAINLEMMADIGYTIPDNWTVDDFLELAALVKARYGGEKWATGMFAANQSGDYLINNWFAAFGAYFYNPGDYSHTTIAETGGVKAYEFFQALVMSGYTPPGAAQLTDDDYVIQWAKGDLAATAFFPSWTKPYFETVIEQGIRDKPFAYKFVAFPRARGVDRVPTYYMNGAIVVRKTGTAADAVAARLAEYLNDAVVQAGTARMTGKLANRTDVNAVPADPAVAQILDIVNANGILDVGLTSAKFQATRAQHFPILQKVLNLQIEPAEAIADYAKRMDEALK